ncbi:MAG: hypothetical protein RQ714_08950 [Nitrosomonas sp.]|nr:hypothetical protein [Nitrosomonas sp.]
MNRALYRLLVYLYMAAFSTYLLSIFVEFAMKLKLFSSVILLAFLPIQANAVPVNWTDWQSVPNASSASGQIAVGTTLVNVNYTGTGTPSYKPALEPISGQEQPILMAQLTMRANTK